MTEKKSMPYESSSWYDLNVHTIISTSFANGHGSYAQPVPYRYHFVMKKKKKEEKY